MPEAAATLRVVDYTMKREPDGQYRRLPVSESMKHMATGTQPWPTADGRWFLPHFNLPHLERRVLDVLGCESTPASVSAAISRWNADALEAAIAEAHACGGKVRTREEWLTHPQCAYLAARPVVEIIKVAEGEPEPLPPGDRPLLGVRVLDLTRILAGPTAGRTLAEHGADVLMVAAPHLPQVPEYVRDLSHGKRSCFLDLRRDDGAGCLAALAREADVFVNGYRPGQLGGRGFGLEDLVGLRPGLIVASISCFGSGGPFATRVGWEQIAQSVSGIAHTHGEVTGVGRPKLAPAPICDYLTGYLAAFGAMLALARRAREGGSYHVQASLCQSAML
ncbi:CoA transferase [Belnapia mucosa]|uniref:CoA transferase n=1 Tax=Belnapia mucosa TaxID=2804532 RepID=UPI002E2A00A2|nr:CoA transferase [Belnapia mucosa]